jgi:hypothetical protein
LSRLRFSILILAIFAVAVFLSGGLRPLILAPPATPEDAMGLTIGSWSGAEGYGSFESDIEIEFHTDSTYTIKFQGWNKQWHERHGSYVVGMVPDTAPGKMRCVVIFNRAGEADKEIFTKLRRTDSAGVPSMYVNEWYFEGGTRLYSARGSSVVSKAMKWHEIILWYCAIPLLLSIVPVLLLAKPRGRIRTESEVVETVPPVDGPDPGN